MTLFEKTLKQIVPVLQLVPLKRKKELVKFLYKLNKLQGGKNADLNLFLCRRCFTLDLLNINCLSDNKTQSCCKKKTRISDKYKNLLISLDELKSKEFKTNF